MIIEYTDESKRLGTDDDGTDLGGTGQRSRLAVTTGGAIRQSENLNLWTT